MMGLGVVTAQVTRATLTPDGDGNNVKVWGVVAANVTVRLITMNAYEVEAHATLEARMTHNVAFDGDYDIRKSDHILIGARVLLVQDVIPADQFSGKYTVAQCLEMSGRAE